MTEQQFRSLTRYEQTLRGALDGKTVTLQAAEKAAFEAVAGKLPCSCAGGTKRREKLRELAQEYFAFKK